MTDREGDESPADGVPDELADAALIALHRAQATARARGLRPGMRPRSSPLATAASMEASGIADNRTANGRRSDDGRDPVGAGGTLSRLIAERGWTRSVTVGGVVGRWDEIVGPQIAEHCQPESFAEGNVVVRADSTAWATQLRLLMPQLMARLAEEFGEGVVTRIDVQGPRGPSWTKGLRTVKGRGPRDTYG